MSLLYTLSLVNVFSGDVTKRLKISTITPIFEKRDNKALFTQQSPISRANHIKDNKKNV